MFIIQFVKFEMRWACRCQGIPSLIRKINRYNVTASKSICAEFDIDPNSDFRFTGGKNRGLGSVFIWLRGPTSTDYEYPGEYKLSDMGGKAEDGNLIYYIFNSLSKKQLCVRGWHSWLDL